MYIYIYIYTVYAWLNESTCCYMFLLTVQTTPIFTERWGGCRLTGCYSFVYRREMRSCSSSDWILWYGSVTVTDRFYSLQNTYTLYVYMHRCTCVTVTDLWSCLNHPGNECGHTEGMTHLEIDGKHLASLTIMMPACLSFCLLHYIPLDSIPFCWITLG